MMARMDVVRALEQSDAREHALVVRDADSDSGTDGRYYNAYSKHDPYDVDAVTERTLQRWSTVTSEPNWRRSWGWFRQGQLVGHIDLVGGSFSGEMHRVHMGMSLLAAHRRMGGGSRLLHAAIDWATAHPDIDWMDLGVFVGNDPAYALYKKFGFVETGRTADRFRVDGVVIDCINMSLPVVDGAPPPPPP